MPAIQRPAELIEVAQLGNGTGGDGTPLGAGNIIAASGGVTIADIGQGNSDLASLSSSSIANALWRPYYQILLDNFSDISAAMSPLNSEAGSITLPGPPNVTVGELVADAIATNPNPSFTDPLLLDLTGAGINVSNWVRSPVYFDTNVLPDANGNPTTTPDGMLHQTAWMATGTGMLVFEANGTVSPITNITQTVSQFLNAGPTPGKYSDGLAAFVKINIENRFGLARRRLSI